MQTQREDKSKIDNPNIKISNLSSLKEVKVTARTRRESLSVSEKLDRAPVYYYLVGKEYQDNWFIQWIMIHPVATECMFPHERVYEQL